MAAEQTNDELKKFLDKWQSVECSYTNCFNGGNNSSNPVIHEFNGVRHIIPAKCKFLNIDIQNIRHTDLENGYDFVSMDPPWWNKYVRRSRKFNKDHG